MSVTTFDAIPMHTGTSPAKAWLRALELTTPIARNPRRILSTVIDEQALSSPDAPALLSDHECMTYRALARRSRQYGRWAIGQGLAKGNTVCLIMPNRPEYMAIWLGVTGSGCAVALLNTNLTGASLAHCVNIVAPKHIIVAAELLDQLVSALPRFTEPAEIWVHGAGDHMFRRIDEELEHHSAEEVCEADRIPGTGGAVTIADRALYIYTSGTTGLPKAVNISHARLMQWSHWFAGLQQTCASDRLYNCLPMYHSVGGVLATGAVLVTGGSVVVCANFSAGRFWSDVVRWDCTLFQYIGELCRYLLHTAASPLETQHRLRLCCGNGLRSDIWEAFKTRFRIPRILEFYAATEGNVSLFNVEGRRGSIGRIPPYLAHRFPASLVRFDVEKEKPIRNAQGFCIRCAPNEPGEAIGRMYDESSIIGSQFEGYTSVEATAAKILRNVFEPEDTWFHTGDLMRRDDEGYFYFVDRIGDTFRWKGENVATSEVSAAICTFPGITQANVYGVPIPGADGRAGMAMLVAGNELNLAAFREHLVKHLPDYARPLFVRVRKEIEMTTTFKCIKSHLLREGYNPAATSDSIYFNHPEFGAFVPLNTELYERIQSSQMRL